MKSYSLYIELLKPRIVAFKIVRPKENISDLKGL